MPTATVGNVEPNHKNKLAIVALSRFGSHRQKTKAKQTQLILRYIKKEYNNKNLPVEG